MIDGSGDDWEDTAGVVGDEESDSDGAEDEDL